MSCVSVKIGLQGAGSVEVDVPQRGGVSAEVLRGSCRASVRGLGTARAVIMGMGGVGAYLVCEAGRVATRQAQLFSGTTAMGDPYTLTNSTTAFSITAGTWTAAQLNNAKLRLYGVRGSSSTTTNYYFRLYGATIEVTYTAPAGNKVYIKSGGTWKEASKIYVKVGGTWKEVSKAYKKVNGSWVEQSDKSAMFDSNAIYKKG